MTATVKEEAKAQGIGTLAKNERGEIGLLDAAGGLVILYSPLGDFRQGRRASKEGAVWTIFRGEITLSQ